MNQNRLRPMATTTVIAGVLIGGGCVFLYYEQKLSAILILLLAGLLLSINKYLIRSSMLFLNERVNKNQLVQYRNFAKFYLTDRRLQYSKKTFEQALDYGWLDIVTMCLLMGIRQYYKEEEQMRIMDKVLVHKQKNIFEILVRAGFSGDFIIPETGEHFIYKVIIEEDPYYLQILLENHINPNERNKDGETPIFEAIRRDYVEHVELFIRYKANLQVQNKEGLTPLFYALQKGRIHCCEKIITQLRKEEKKQEIIFKQLSEPLVLNPKLEPDDKTDIFMQLIASKDPKILELLKDYFTNKKDYYIEVKTGIDLYARLTTMRASMEKQRIQSQEVRFMESEEECKKDLYKHILKKYTFDSVDNFKIHSIYDRPRIVDSDKELCEVCEGEGYVGCIACDTTGTVECPKCKGRGKHTCSLCEGTNKISCEKLKKYIECQMCKDGEYTCAKCNEKGVEICPTCKGHGTTKCQCPRDKKISCPHCDRGYISLRNGMYRKCTHCHDGLVCGLCGNTGWVKEHFKTKGFKCRTCNGDKVVECTTCKGSKKVKCTKRYQAPCTCQGGEETCKTCGGSKVDGCKVCNGTGKVICSACDKGYVYKHIAIDFKANQELISEKIISSENKVSKLSKMQQKMIPYVIQNNQMIHTVYTIKNIGMRPSDVSIRNVHIQKEVHKMIEELSGDRVLDILELIPLDYMTVTFKHRDGDKSEEILVNGYYYS